MKVLLASALAFSGLGYSVEFENRMCANSGSEVKPIEFCLATAGQSNSSFIGVKEGKGDMLYFNVTSITTLAGDKQQFIFQWNDKVILDPTTDGYTHTGIVTYAGKVYGDDTPLRFFNIGDQPPSL